MNDNMTFFYKPTSVLYILLYTTNVRRLFMNYKAIIKDILNNVSYTEDNNYFSFFDNGDIRPEWSRRLNDYLTINKADLNMKVNYENYLNAINTNRNLKKIYIFIKEKKGIKVDLASGPSGFFYPIVANSTENDIVIVTDACKYILDDINNTCQKENFFIFDIDLDKSLPFKENSVSVFSSNLLSNCKEYEQIIKEVYKCLERKGRFVVIEWFYEKEKATYKYLDDNNQIIVSMDKYIEYCERLGFKYIGNRLMKTRKGKLDGDLFPLDENEVVYEKALFFEKN